MRGGTNDPETESDLLITRIIDGEAAEEDRDRFNELSAMDPTLWRRMALRQQDMHALTDDVALATRAAVRVDVPRRWFAPGRLTWPLAMSGWAAMFILAATWWALLPQDDSATTPLSHEQAFSRYLSAPYVLGDLKPEVLEVEPMVDGRVALRFVRRIEEIAFVDEKTLPLDSDGALTKDLGRLRASEPDIDLTE